LPWYSWIFMGLLAFALGVWTTGVVRGSLAPVAPATQMAQVAVLAVTASGLSVLWLAPG
jgi:hypothetical protein